MEYGNSKIRAIALDRTVTTLAGGGYGDANKAFMRNGAGTNAGFQQPHGVAVTPGGVVVVADTNSNVIRAITPGGVTTTLAGGGVSKMTPGWEDGVGSASGLWNPGGIVFSGNDDLLFADSNNHNHKIRSFNPASGAVTTFVGGGASGYASGSTNGVGTAALFCSPQAVAVSAGGVVYVTDSSPNCLVRAVTPGGVVSTLAGGTCGVADGVGTTAAFVNLQGVAVAASGTIFVTDDWLYAPLRQMAQQRHCLTVPPTAFGLLFETGQTRAFSRPSALRLIKIITCTSLIVETVRYV